MRSRRILFHHRIRADDGQAVHVRELIGALRQQGHEVLECALVPKAGNVAGWPEILPHYRWVQTLDRTAGGTIVNMAARRGPIPIKWTSEVRLDEEKKEELERSGEIFQMPE